MAAQSRGHATCCEAEMVAILPKGIAMVEKELLQRPGGPPPGATGERWPRPALGRGLSGAKGMALHSFRAGASQPGV